MLIVTHLESDYPLARLVPAQKRLARLTVLFGCAKLLLDGVNHSANQGHHPYHNGNRQSKALVEMKGPYYAPGVDQPRSKTRADQVEKQFEDNHNSLLPVYISLRIARPMVAA